MFWEYRIIEVDKFGLTGTRIMDSHHPDGSYSLEGPGLRGKPSDNRRLLADAFTQLGREGWEVAVALRSQDQRWAQYVFKRAQRNR